MLQVLNLLYAAVGLWNALKAVKGGIKKKKDASEKEHVFLLRSDSIVEKGWDCGCRWYYKQNNEMML